LVNLSLPSERVRKQEREREIKSARAPARKGERMFFTCIKMHMQLVN